MNPLLNPEGHQPPASYPAYAEAALAMDALAPFDNPALLTQDELACLRVVREAIAAVAAGETLEPPAEGQPLKMRLLRRVEFSYFHHAAPRPRVTPSPPSGERAGVRGQPRPNELPAPEPAPVATEANPT